MIMRNSVKNVGDIFLLLLKLEMMRFIFLLLILISVSCSQKTEFTQLKKDWDNMVEENFDEETSPEIIADSSAQVKNQPDTTTQVEPPSSFDTVDKRQDLVDFAHQYIGTPYKFACSTPEEGFDCSGFLYYVFNKFGYTVPRSSKEYEFLGKEVPVNSAKRGDLVLFTPTENDTSGERIGHIGILINEKGMNSDFIHASSGNANGVTVSSLGSDHYTQRFVKVINIMD